MAVWGQNPVAYCPLMRQSALGDVSSAYYGEYDYSGGNQRNYVLCLSCSSDIRLASCGGKRGENKCCSRCVT